MTGMAHVRSRAWLAEQAMKTARDRLASILAVPEPLRNPASVDSAVFILDAARKRLAEAEQEVLDKHPTKPVPRAMYGRHRNPTRKQHYAR